eukprot:bmy_18490T0
MCHTSSSEGCQPVCCGPLGCAPICCPPLVCGSDCGHPDPPRVSAVLSHRLHCHLLPAGLRPSVRVLPCGLRPNLLPQPGLLRGLDLPAHRMRGLLLPRLHLYACFPLHPRLLLKPWPPKPWLPGHG